MDQKDQRPHKFVWPLQAMPLARAMSLSYALLIIYVSLNPFDFNTLIVYSPISGKDVNSFDNSSGFESLQLVTLASSPASLASRFFVTNYKSKD